MTLLIIVLIVLIVWFLDAVIIAMSNDAVSLFISCIPFLVSLFILKAFLNFLINDLTIMNILNLSALLISLIIVIKCLMILTSS